MCIQRAEILFDVESGSDPSFLHLALGRVCTGRCRDSNNFLDNRKICLTGRGKYQNKFFRVITSSTVKGRCQWGRFFLFLYKSVWHRSFSQLLQPFRLCHKIFCGDIHNRKFTPSYQRGSAKKSLLFFKPLNNPCTSLVYFLPNCFFKGP
jgi:hypothetical protein